MAKISVKAGSTGVSLPIFIQASTSTAGLGLSGLVGTSAGLIAWYYRGTGTAVPITLATSSLNAAYTSGLFVQVNSTAMAGFYRLDPPDAVFAAGVRSAAIMLSGAASMAPLALEVELTAWDNQDAVAGGLISLSSTGTLGSVSNVRGTSTVLLAGAVHTGAIIPQVQTASVALVANVVGTATSVINVLGTATGVLAAGTHTGAIIPIVQTASVALTANTVGTASSVGSVAVVDTVRTSTVSDFTAGALARYFDLDAGQYSTSSAQSVVKQIAANSGGGTPPTVEQITTAVWQKFGTGTVMLSTGLHTGAIIPVVQTASVSLTANTVGTASSVGSVATVDTVRTSTVSNFTAAALARYFDLDAGQYTTSSAQSVVKQIADNSGGASAPTVAQITTAVWAKFGTGTVMLSTGTHVGAVIPTVNAVTTSNDGRMANLDLNVGAVGTLAAAAGTSALQVGTQVKALIGTGTSGSISGDLLEVTTNILSAKPITSNIKQNQALANFEFLMTTGADHSPGTGLTVTVTRSIDGSGQLSGALSTSSEIGVGMYGVDFAASDLNGKVVTLRATASGADDTFITIITQP